MSNAQKLWPFVVVGIFLGCVGCRICPCFESGAADAGFAKDKSWIARTIKSPTQQIVDGVASGGSPLSCPTIIPGEGNMHPLLKEVVADEISGKVHWEPLLGEDNQWHPSTNIKRLVPNGRPLSQSDIEKLGFQCEGTTCNYKATTYTLYSGFKDRPLNDVKQFQDIRVCIDLKTSPAEVTATSSERISKTFVQRR